MGRPSKDLTSRWVFGDPNTRERRFFFNRESALERSRERLSVPTLKCCLKYNFTAQELQPILDALILSVKQQYPTDDHFISTIPTGIIKKKENLTTIDESDYYSESDTESDFGYSTEESFL